MRHRSWIFYEVDGEAPDMEGLVAMGRKGKRRAKVLRSNLGVKAGDSWNRVESASQKLA